MVVQLLFDDGGGAGRPARRPRSAAAGRCARRRARRGTRALVRPAHLGRRVRHAAVRDLRHAGRGGVRRLRAVDLVARSGARPVRGHLAQVPDGQRLEHAALHAKAGRVPGRRRAPSLRLWKTRLRARLAARGRESWAEQEMPVLSELRTVPQRSAALVLAHLRKRRG